MNVSRIHRLAREFSWILVGQLASVLGAVILVRVLTEYLSPAQYGELALGLTVAGLVNQVVTGGINAGIIRFYSIAAEKSELNGYLFASRKLMLTASAVVVSMAVVIMVGLSWTGYSQWMGVVTAALLFSILSGYNSSLSGIQNAARQRAIVALHGGLDAWLKILLALAFMRWLGETSTAVILGYTLAALLVTGSQLLLLQKAIPHADRSSLASENWTAQILSYSWPFLIFGFFTWLHQASDRWALQVFSTASDVGLYAVVFQLGYMPIGVATGLVVTFLVPIVYQRSGGAAASPNKMDAHRLTWRIALVCLGMTSGAFIFMLLWHDELFRVLVAEEYRWASYFLPWMVFAGGVFAAGQMLALKLMADMRTSALTPIKIITAIVGVLMNIFGALAYGVAGVVAAQVAFSLIYFLWMMRLAWR